MKLSSNIHLKERKQFVFDGFMGVDFSSSPLRVAANRAINMKNFIHENGVNKKRNGWCEMLCFSDPINGIFQYNDITIVHAGTTFYKCKLENGEIKSDEIIPSTDVNIANQKSQAFMNKGKLYIIGCGDFLVYGPKKEVSETAEQGTETVEEYELRRVFDDEDTYIPTTTISIDALDATGEENDEHRASLDAVNLLCTKRKNKLVGNAANSTWKLDKSIESGTEVKIEVEVLKKINETQKLITLKLNCTNNRLTCYEIFDGESCLTLDGSNLTELNGEAFTGAIDFGAGTITLDFNTTIGNPGVGNITVTFKAEKEEAYDNKIENCQFGILFGVNGNSDRLFLSGNDDYSNIIFYSEEDDFTYFGDQNTIKAGGDSTAVNAFARLSDNALAIYKEGSQDSSIYYTTGSYKEYYDSNGNLDKMVGVFPTSAGGIGESVISRHACANFCGDNVILSKNGVFGIVLGENIATNERYTKERSRSINEKIKHKDLSNAAAIVYKSRYYLSIDNECYVADSRYKYMSQDSVDGSYNYEWWFWDNIPARVWAVLNDELWFGTEDGKLCKFDDEYTDRTYQKIPKGGLSLHCGSAKANTKITKDSNLALYNNDIIKFDKNETFAVYAKIFSDVTIEAFQEENKKKITVSESEENREQFKTITEQSNIYVVQGNEEIGPFECTNIDRGSCSFEIEDINNELTNGTYDICKEISDCELYVTNVEGDTSQVKEHINGQPLDLYQANSTTPSLTGKIIHKENVVAEWLTPVLDFGTNESSKTLLKMTISTMPEINGKISFGYNTRSIRKILSAKGVHHFSFDAFSFENFTFEPNFASSYSVRCNERNFNFIMFRFLSDNDSNCIINNFTAVYKINKQNKGVM